MAVKKRAVPPFKRRNDKSDNKSPFTPFIFILLKHKFFCFFLKTSAAENPQLRPRVNKPMSHVIFLDAGEGPSMEEMSLNNRAGMRLQLQLQRRATCALMQEARERRALYAAHDLTPMRTLWTAPPLFIVSSSPHVTYLRGARAVWDTCDTGTPRTGREVGERDLMPGGLWRDGPGDSRRYTWSHSLPAQLHGPTCAKNPKETVSQHLLRPWKFLLFVSAPGLGLLPVAAAAAAARCCPDREAGAGISQRSLQAGGGVSQLPGLLQKDLSESCVY